jgi:hypothetical protein
MPRRGFALLFCAFCACAPTQPALAQPNDRNNQQRFGFVQIGEFQAGDDARFSLSRYRGQYLLRFNGEPEVFVLYDVSGSLGGRVLRYDSGAIAIQIAGWGAMTVYPDNKPEGLPAMRTGDAPSPSLPIVSQSQLMGAADDEASHLAYVRGLHFTFTADWNAMANDGGTRSVAYDALENAARGIARFAASPAGRDVFAQKVASVRLQTSPKPLIQLVGNVLIVTFNPGQGYMGRASSRAIAFALGKAFHVPIPN